MFNIRYSERMLNIYCNFTCIHQAGTHFAVASCIVIHMHTILCTLFCINSVTRQLATPLNFIYHFFIFCAKCHETTRILGESCIYQISWSVCDYFFHKFRSDQAFNYLHCSTRFQHWPWIHFFLPFLNFVYLCIIKRNVQFFFRLFASVFTFFIKTFVVFVTLVSVNTGVISSA